MSRAAVRGLALLGLALGAHFSALALEPDQVFDRVSPSIWSVRTQDAAGRPLAEGSAVVVAPGRVVTSCQLLARASAVRVVREQQNFAASLELPDPERDLCQLKVEGLAAPAVTLAEPARARVGIRVYAIGTPQGMDATLSDGLLSGMRRDAEGAVRYMQTTAVLAPGVAGGGLFDAEARLLGFLSSAKAEGSGQSLATPVALYADLQARGAQALAQFAAGPRPAPVVPVAASSIAEGARRAGDWFEYRYTDNTTRVSNTFSLNVDRVNEGRVTFNGGARVEGPMGELIESGGGLLGELDTLQPPGGWDAFLKAGGPGLRPLRFSSKLQNGQAVKFDLRATVMAAEKFTVGQQQVDAVRIDLIGWADRPSITSGATYNIQTGYRASVLYSPEVRRVLRFSMERRTPFAREGLELIRMGNR